MTAGGNKVRVVARIRPLSNKEIGEGSHETLSKLEHGETAMVQVDNDANGAGDKRWFELDAVLDGESSQQDVYVESGAKGAVTEDLFAGFNTSILAYGQTGAGKTFTMGTAVAKTDSDDLDDGAGIIPRACQDLFDSINEKCENATVTLSYLELYNEKIRDLFAENKNSKASQDLRIRETPGGSVEVAGCVERTVKSPGEIGEAMEEAGKRRVVAATAMNATSSRSHAICTLRIRGTLKPAVGDDENSQSNTTKKFSSKLTLVDLAGSERIKKTGAQGARQTEGININKSLLVLGQVVSALSQGSGPGARKPPYRDSKLTRLLQDSLGGNSRTLMIACVSPAHVNLDETTNTLRYAASARRITNRARQNVAVTSTLTPQQAAALKKENASLQEQMAQLQAAMAKMQKELEQAQSQLAATNTDTEKRTTPSRTVSHALTASTTCLSEDDEAASFGEEPNSEPEKDIDEVPEQISVESNKKPESTKSDTTTEEESATQASPADKGVFAVMDGEQQTEEENKSNDELSAEGYGTELDESDGASDWMQDDVDDDVLSLGDIPEEFSTLLRKREAAYFLDVSNYKLMISDLEAKLDIYQSLAQENSELQNELVEAREDAESARKAANLLSDIVDELRDIKRGELEEKQQQLQMTLKEQNWISFVQVMLQNYRMQVSQLSTAFNKTVVRTIDNLDFTEKKSEPEEKPEPEATQIADSQGTPEDSTVKTNAEKSETTTETSAETKDKETVTPETPVKPLKRARRRSWWGGIVEEAVPEPPKILPWKEATEKFDEEIRRLENMLIDETKSMQEVQTNLLKEVRELETEVGAKKRETESMFTSTKDTEHDELLEHLSSILLQKSVHSKA